MPGEPQISLAFLAVSHYLAAAVLVGVVAALLTGFHRVFGSPYLRYWAVSWWAFALYEGAGAASIAVSQLRADDPARLALSALAQVGSAVQLTFLLIGTWCVTRGLEPRRRTARALLAGALALGLVQGLVFSWNPSLGMLRLFVRVGLRQVLAFAAAVVAAYWLARASEAKGDLGRRSLPIALVGWGACQVGVLGVIAAGRSGAPRVFAALTLLDLAVHGLLAVATVAWLLGAERARENERMALAAAMRRTETMAALGALVSGVAHEVRNPLFGITSTVEALAIHGQGAEEFRPHLGVLRTEADRLNALMRDLLEYGRPSTQRIVPGCLPDVVAEAVRATSALAGDRGVRVGCAIPGDTPAVPMDGRRVVQVFQNLIDNAIRHSPAGGAVRVSSTLEPDGEWVACTVDDEGPGFPPGEEGRIFQPFYSRRRGGTGLGLSIAQRIVEEHGGTVAAARRPEGGARLTVRLPLRRA